MSLSINVKALAIVQQILEMNEELGCSVKELENGSTVIDAGINVEGSIELGRLISEICLGGLGAVRLSDTHIDDMTIPVVVTSTKQPKIASMASQLAGWAIRKADFFALGSGPARALARVEEIFSDLGYSDDSQHGVIMLETRTSPSEDITNYIAKKCSISPSSLFCIVAPTASIVGSVHIASRVISAGIQRLHALGFALDKIRTAHGTCPIAPVTENDTLAMRVTNDCIINGGRVFCHVRSDESENLGDLAKEVPSSEVRNHGLSFEEVFVKAELDFYDVDNRLLSPAEITLNDITSGDIYRAGGINPEPLRAIFARCL